ncbi:MAG TPA: preprotein translocase subunit SecG [Candidatus Margulisiibacteriota bacterium]|nr:preprotein translocase subunit SecG [Candidatus Margulisiibacteriota bacterium]
MLIVVTIIHVIACLFLIGVVLLQQGKGADMGAVFGGSSSTIFGSGGAGNFLTRLTTIMAVVFMLTSLTLTYTGARRVSSTVFDSAPLQEAPPLEVPAQPQAGGAPAQAPAPAPANEPAAAAPQAAAPQAAAPQAAAPQAAVPAPPQGSAPAGEPASD